MSCRHAVAGLLLGALLPAQEVKTVLGNGSTHNRYDLVILGDGYTAAEQGQFDADVLAAMTGLFQKEPYRTLAAYFNVHSVFRASRESGADHPDADPPVLRDTAYGASYDTGGTPRCLYIQNISLALQDASLAPSVEGRVMVLVNDSRYGGCAGTFSVSYNGASMIEVQAHELGHSFGGLADEYETLNQVYTGPEPAEKNVTASPTGDKWSQWHGFGGVAAYEGARYYRYGLYRPRFDCLMRNLGIAHCPVCTEQLFLEVHETVTPIEHPIPTVPSVVLELGDLQPFSFQSLIPSSESSTVVWRVDGEVQPFATTSFLLDTAAVGPGEHLVEVELTHDTPFVRVDPYELLSSRHQWLVTVVDPGAPDLAVESVQGIDAMAGGTVEISTTIRNDGTTGSGTFTLEHFLSTEPDPAEDDIYLGSTEVSNLVPGERRTVVRSEVRVPARAGAGARFLSARLDRIDDVVESNEENNSASVFAALTGPGCGPYLEYRDPLLYPHDSARVKILPGGTAMPTVIAPCAPPGTFYLVVMGCSGTVPGTTLPSGVTVPINADACTNLALAALNYPAFAGFYGPVDELGLGNAAFNLPPGLPIPQITAHFAALLVDAAGNFTATTEPVGLIIGF